MLNFNLKNFLFLFLISICSFGQNKAVELRENEEHQKIDIFIDKELFTSYLFDTESTIKKPILFPINSSQGNYITRGWPLDPKPLEREDHPHQVGLWLNHGDVNGNDFWNNSIAVKKEGKRYGTIVHREIKRIKSGKKNGQLIVRSDWLDHNGEKMLLEETSFLFSGTKDSRTIIRTTSLIAYTDVLFADNKEGMLGLRLRNELEHEDDKMPFVATGEYQNDLNGRGLEVWGKRSEWMNLSGHIEEEEISILILDHKDNYNFPSHWHARGYGLFAVNPIGSEVFTRGKEVSDLTLLKGESLSFKHLIFISSKHLSEEEIILQATRFQKK